MACCERWPRPVIGQLVESGPGESSRLRKAKKEGSLTGRSVWYDDDDFDVTMLTPDIVRLKDGVFFLEEEWKHYDADIESEIFKNGKSDCW